MDKLNLLKLFIASAESSSFVGAAKQFGIAPSTVSKAVSRLENSLGVRLLHRTTRQIKLTEEGKEYLETARQVILQLDRGEAFIQKRKEKPQGTLKINLPLSFGQRYILPLMPKFKESYPDILLELSFSDEYVDLVEGGIDLAFRSGTMENSQLIARKICPIDFAIFASDDYLDKFDPPRSPADFEEHDWIGFKFKQTGRMLDVHLASDGTLKLLSVKPTILVDNGEAAAELTVQGMGLCYLPHFLARDLVRGKKLTLVSTPHRSPDQAVSLFYVSRDFLPAKTRVFITFIQEELRQQGETAHSTWLIPE